jgi:ubiquinone/menaquinone biosynthesis C-methylase UbiE
MMWGADIQVLSCAVVAVVVAVSVLLLGFIVMGSLRTTLTRKTSFQGIEDPEVVNAYDRMSRMPQFALIRRMFVNELKRHDPEGLIVDVGCGPGYLMADIARKMPQAKITGVDISEEMLAAASKNLSLLGFGGRVEFRKGEAQRLPFGNSSIDNIVSTLSLHHWAQPAEAFQEIYRVLKPGGQLLLMDMRRDPRRFFYWLIIFATRIAPSFMGTKALRRINEPLGSILASYTPPELALMVSKIPFANASIKSGLGWFFLWGQK